MAVAIEIKFPGATVAQYDQMVEKAGLTPGGAMPPGGIAHWVAQTDDGLHIVDVWESREVFDQYAAEFIGPVSAEVGMTEPELRFYDVHNYFTRA